MILGPAADAPAGRLRHHRSPGWLAPIKYDKRQLRLPAPNRVPPTLGPVTRTRVTDSRISPEVLLRRPDRGGAWGLRRKDAQ